MGIGGKAVFALLALALAGAAARADTLSALRAQASQPLAATIEVCGRTVELSAAADVPDAEAMGVYLAGCASFLERTGEAAYVEPPEKRRGIAVRKRDPEVFAPGELPGDYRAFGHPQTAAEAIDSVWALVEPRVQALDGVAASLSRVTGRSPYYFYDKEAGEWLDVAVEGDVGAYEIAYEPTLYGAPVFAVTPFYRDEEAYNAEGAWADSVLGADLRAGVEVTAEGEPCAWAQGSLPEVRETLAQDVGFAPLADVWATLCETARAGHLRQIFSLRLGYLGFEYGERTETWVDPSEKTYLIKPVWVCHCEAYSDPQMEAYDVYGYWWSLEADIVIDAQTGEMIERARIGAEE